MRRYVVLGLLIGAALAAAILYSVAPLDPGPRFHGTSGEW